MFHSVFGAVGAGISFDTKVVSAAVQVLRERVRRWRKEYGNQQPSNLHDSLIPINTMFNVILFVSSTFSNLISYKIDFEHLTEAKIIHIPFAVSCLVQRLCITKRQIDNPSIRVSYACACVH